MESIRALIAEQLGVDPQKITAETSFVEDLGTDSLDTAELVMELQEELDISIAREDAEKIRTVGDAVQFLDGQAVVDRDDEPRPSPDATRYDSRPSSLYVMFALVVAALAMLACYALLNVFVNGF